MGKASRTGRRGRREPEARAESLEQSEERFRTLVEYAPEAMVILDADSGCFVDANSNACRLFGLSRAALLKLGPAAVSPEQQPDGKSSAESASSWIRETVEGRHSVFEWVHQNAGGDPVPCEVRLVSLPHQDHRWVRASIIDISDRKQAEAERERLTAELAQAQKLQAIGQLTGGVAHDFNNLLTVIMSSVEMIENGADDPEKVRSLARQATTAAQRAAALTQRLLAFARRQPLRPQVVDTNKLLAGLESLLRRTLGETITVRTVFGSGLWHCEVDPAQLENVILNLGINARDAMPEGGELVIETSNEVLEGGPLRDQDQVAPGDYVLLVVRDNGTGMHPQVLSHVFEPFFTTKATGSGSGLGLSTIYGFVRQSGGHVSISSKPAAGTTVQVYLPRSLSPPAGEQDCRRPPFQTTPQGNGRLVLVVEDEPSVRTLVVAELESLGYRTLNASEAKSALATLEEALEVSLVLTDVVLPGGMNGIELAREAQALYPDLPVLYMSGYTQDAVLRDGRLDPGISLLEKPFSRRDLATAVHAILDAHANSH